MTRSSTLVTKQMANHGVGWESIYGYAQAVKVGNIIYVSGQLSHDEAGALIAPAPLGPDGRPTDFANMAAQMHATYENAGRLLAHFGATFDQIVEETLFVLDVDASFAVAGEVRRRFYGPSPQLASNLIGVSRLAFPEQLIEVVYRADLSLPRK